MILRTSRTKLMTSLGLSAALVATILFAATTVRSSADPGKGDRGSASSYLAPGSVGSPRFAIDPQWPLELPNNWIIGQVGGLSVDKSDNIWVYQRPGTDTTDELDAAQTPQVAGCCLPAPPVMEFNSKGVLLTAWGPIRGAPCPTAAGPCNSGPTTGYSWFANGGEHGIFATDDGFVWLAGNGGGDSQALKFTRNGTFVLQIGSEGQACPNNLATTYICHSSQFYVDTPNNEVYISDGYSNNRVAVFNATTAAFKRAWGAFGVTATTGFASTGYGVIPPLAASYAPVPPYTAGNPSSYFRNPVHCVTRDPNTGYIWVCDRVNDRAQVFTTAGKYVGQCYFATSTLGPGSVWDMKFWPKRGGKNEVILSTDGTNQIVREFLPKPDPSSGTTTGSQYCRVTGQFGHSGRNAGFFHWVHVADVDSNGNYYEGEVDTGKRIQKFVPIGGNPGDNDHR
jgi:hypothetical protein